MRNDVLQYDGQVTKRDWLPDLRDLTDSDRVQQARNEVAVGGRKVWPNMSAVGDWHKAAMRSNAKIVGHHDPRSSFVIAPSPKTAEIFNDAPIHGTRRLVLNCVDPLHQALIVPCPR